MRLRTRIAMLSLSTVLMLGTLATVSQARTRHASRVAVPAGTPVTLVFDQTLSSKTAKVGQQVKFSVADDVMVGSTLVIKKGTPVTGVIAKAEKRKRFGVNATIRIALNPVKSTQGARIALEPRSQGHPVEGEKSGQGAAATVGGAAILGPVGLVGGYFVSGKDVEVKPGDKLETEVSGKPDAPAASAGPIPAGTEVDLVFDQALNSSKAKVGQRVRLSVADDVVVDDKVVIRKGAPVTGVIEKAEKRKPYGVNATIRIALRPIKSVQGAEVMLQPRSQGQPVGEKTGGAAAATVGGAAVLGPVGLVGGYFISGKAVEIKRGDKLVTEVAKSVARRHRR